MVAAVLLERRIAWCFEPIGDSFPTTYLLVLRRLRLDFLILHGKQLNLILVVIVIGCLYDLVIVAKQMVQREVGSIYTILSSCS